MARSKSHSVSTKAGTAASKVLRKPKSSTGAKTTAASALTQRAIKAPSSITVRTLNDSAERYSDALERLAKR
jgi:hypothetical protein